MRSAIVCALFVALSAIAVPALAQSAGLHSVSFADLTDEDGDGYYSDFDIEVHADTQCYGCYDEQTIGGNPEMEPFFRVIVNDVDLVDTDIVFRDGDFRGTIRVPQDQLEQFERQTLNVGVVLFDSDPIVDDIVDSWEGTIRYEPSWEDTPTPEPDTPTPEPDTPTPEPDTPTPEPATDASIVGFEPPNGTYRTGEVARANVTVENTGDTAHTFFVGYGVVGPNGTVYDNEGTTGTAVTIPPGETETVPVSWVVERDAPLGTYDVGTAVWQESNPDELETRLDEAVRESAFKVAGSEETAETTPEATAAEVTTTGMTTVNATTTEPA